MLLVGGVSRAQASTKTASKQKGVEIFLTQAKLPTETNATKSTKSNTTKSTKKVSLSQFARKNQAKLLDETKETELRDRKWVAKLVLAFKAPPQEAELNLVYYDVQNGSKNKQMVKTSMMMLPQAETQTEFQKTIKLPREEFKANRKIELVLTMPDKQNGGLREIGRTTFTPVGTVPKRSNKIDFTEEETGGRISRGAPPAMSKL